MQHKPTTQSYLIGFMLAVILTLASFSLPWIHQATGHRFPSHDAIKVGLVTFAIIQLFVQMIFFLHLGKEKRPKYNFITFSLALLFVLIVVGGSLWIMDNLNHNMSHEQMEEYMYKEVGI